MALASLIDAGADLDQLVAMLERLPIKGWSLSCSKELRGGIAGTRALVLADESDGITRNLADITAIIVAGELPTRVTERALAIFTGLARAEAGVHNEAIEDVHFHEVGGHDAVIDIVGVCIGLELLDIDVVESSAVAQGQGMVRSRHGLLPNPPPAVVALLAGAPVYGRDLNVELTTPTGAAILASLARRFGPIPEMTIVSTGYGAGGRELDGLPNLTQVVIGQSDDLDRQSPKGQPLVVLEANIDDATGEQLADALVLVLEEGAADCWITPVVMKKGRPGYVVSVLCDPALETRLAQVLLQETGSFGLRSSRVDRFATTRREDEVDLFETTVRVKVSPGRAKVEHDDILAIARRIGRPPREVQGLAEQAFRQANLAGQGDDTGQH